VSIILTFIKSLALYPHLGLAYYPPDNFTWSRYNTAYFNKYKEYETSRKYMTTTWDINKFRLNITNKYTVGVVLDVGVGAGTFLKYRSEMYVEPHKTFGYDINPKGVEFLKSRDAFLDPYKEPDNSIECITLWDVIEHIEEPQKLLKKVKPGGFVLISTPLYDEITYESITESKHFKPGEHLWYFTKEGLKWMLKGFDLVEESQGEMGYGRESIGTFVFKKQE